MGIISELLIHPATQWLLVVAGVFSFGLLLKKFCTSFEATEQEEEGDE